MQLATTWAGTSLDKSPGMLRGVMGVTVPDVSTDRSAFVLRFKQTKKEALAASNPEHNMQSFVQNECKKNV
jgi:hypothetical protein